MKRKRVIALLFVLLISMRGVAQHSLDTLDTEKYFDFWIGEWEVSWNATDGTREVGKNSVTKILDGNVILEKFEVKSGRMKGFKGRSYTVFAPRIKEWRQTWVDSQGSYLDFKADFEEDKRIFYRTGIGASGREVMQRMIFYDIEKDRFTWDWEISTDRGETWELRWRIFYKRLD